MGSFDLYVHYKGHLCYLGYFWPILMSWQQQYRQ